MPAVEFIDTNIWIYAHLRTPNEPRHPLALALVKHLKNAVVSPQVIAEYYNVILKNRKDDAWIQANIQAILSYTQLQALDASVIQRALWIRQRYGFSYWDCQIVAAALEAGCVTLYSEDMQSGQVINGALTVLNPFS
ncbi:PIN domain-containing protein [Methylosoma difficile]